MAIQKCDLGSLRQMGAPGGFGTVYAAERRLAIWPETLAYKEYHADKLSAAARVAEKCVQFRNSLSDTDKATLDGFAAWPLDVVVDGGKVVGIVMPLLEDFYFHTGAGSHRVPNNLSWMMVPDRDVVGRGSSLGPLRDPTTRLLLATRFAFAVAWFHQHHVVIGDISAKNAFFSTKPSMIKIIDCDGAAVEPGLRDRATTPSWGAPELTGSKLVNSPETDVYKLGLVLLRTLTHNATSGSTTALQRRSPAPLRGVVTAELYDCVEAALSSNPSARPTAAEVYTACYAEVSALLSPPRATQISLSRCVCLRGEEIAVHWSLVGATKLEILAPHDQRVEVDTQRHASGYSFSPRGSGPVSILLFNDHGSSRYDLGWISVHEVVAPKVDFGGRFPRPPYPKAPVVLGDGVWKTLADLPVNHLSTMPIAVESLGVSIAEMRPLLANESGQAPWVDAVQPELDRLLDTVRLVLRGPVNPLP